MHFSREGWIILLIVLTAIFSFRSDVLDFYQKFVQQLPNVEKLVTGAVINEIKKEVSTPPPLRAQKEYENSYLTTSGTINFTNLQRSKEGLPSLKENHLLNLSAQRKVRDMFDKQYFAHDSPTGEGVSELAGQAEYDYIVIGENLALGNFLNDQVLVQAWMDSPGHRANILNGKYTEIGVAVGRGGFEGRMTWLAVQHFGKPISDCPAPDHQIKSNIDNLKSQIDILKQTLDQKKEEIENTRPKHGEEYNKKVDEYNNLVNQYNNYVKEFEFLINQYNQQINQFNRCASA